jgi:lipopolysaccharide biosynthesis regulator YciM
LTADGLPPIERSAGEELFGAKLGEFTHQLSAKWSEQVVEVWKNRHEQASKIATELEELKCDDSDVAGLWKKAAAMLDLKGDDGAAEFVDKVLAADPAHVAATFVKGRRLLAKDDPSGVELIERAMREDEFLTDAGSQILYGYYMRTGRREKLKEIEKALETFHEHQALAQQERATVRAEDAFIPAELTEEQAAQLRQIFANEPDIESVAVARKVVSLFPKHPAFLVALKIKVATWKFRGSDANQLIVNRVLEQVQLPGHFLVFIVEKELAKAGKKIFEVAGALVYRRS